MVYVLGVRGSGGGCSRACIVMLGSLARFYQAAVVATFVLVHVFNTPFASWNTQQTKNSMLLTPQRPHLVVFVVKMVRLAIDVHPYLSCGTVYTHPRGPPTPAPCFPVPRDGKSSNRPRSCFLCAYVSFAVWRFPFRSFDFVRLWLSLYGTLTTIAATTTTTTTNRNASRQTMPLTRSTTAGTSAICWPPPTRLRGTTAPAPKQRRCVARKWCTPCVV